MVGGHMRPLLAGEREWLLARIEQKKDPTLHELLAELREERGVEVCCDTLWRFMGRRGKTGLSGFPCVDGRLNVTPPWL